MRLFIFTLFVMVGRRALYIRAYTTVCIPLLGLWYLFCSIVTTVSIFISNSYPLVSINPDWQAASHVSRNSYSDVNDCRASSDVLPWEEQRKAFAPLFSKNNGLYRLWTIFSLSKQFCLKIHTKLQLKGFFGGKGRDQGKIKILSTCISSAGNLQLCIKNAIFCPFAHAFLTC